MNPYIENPSLRDFANAYMLRKYGQLDTALHAGTFEIEHGMGITLFRHAPFQVQLFLFRPGAVIQHHIHPDVDSYEVHVNGEMELSRNGILMTDLSIISDQKPNGSSKANGGMLYIPRGIDHDGYIRRVGPANSPCGGAFLSIQYWYTSPITSIHENWNNV